MLYNPAYSATELNNDMIILTDPKIKVEKFVDGLEKPTTMAFVDRNDTLILEKNKGTVIRIHNGVIQRQPLLDLNVANKDERGMLGIAVINKHNLTIEENGHSNKYKNSTYVFLYFTKGQITDGEDSDKSKSNLQFSNSLYRYELVSNNTMLVNPRLIFELPATNRTWHNGGALLLGPDGNVYLPTGDLTEPNGTLAENVQNGTTPFGTGGILRFRVGDITDGKGDDGILGNFYPLDKYYAYGIRNSFGIDFDPISGKLWDTENGPNYGDEINLVEVGFNSGWSKVQGIWMPTKNLTAGDVVYKPESLINFNQKNTYSAPEFIWKQTVGPTAIKFFNSDKLGQEYKNDLFVGDVHNGYLYHFDLVENRTAIKFDNNNGPLYDKIADEPSEMRNVIFGKGFGGITDIEVGPYDGFLYIVSHKLGTVFRIVPLEDADKSKS